MKEYLYKPDTDPFHSHGMAKLAHGGGIGATSAETFQQRARRERNRQHVNRYRDSLVMRHRMPTTRYQPISGYDREAGQQERASGAPTLNRRLSEGGAPSRPGFSEPQVRRYNPYE